jgi:cytochrome P450
MGMSAERTSAGPTVEELFDPLSEQYRTDPYRAFRAARDSCPVVRVGDGEFVAVGRDEIMSIQRDHDRFLGRSNRDKVYQFADEAREILENSLYFRVGKLNMGPPAHTEFRAFVNGFFEPRRLRVLEPYVRSLAQRLVAGFAADGEADLLTRYAYPLPMTVICELIGIPEADRATVKAWNNAWMALQVAPLTPQRQVECARASVAYERYIADLLAQRRWEPAEDMLSAFAREAASDRPVATVEDAIVSVRGMLAAGHETTTNLIGNAVYHLLAEPSRWQAVVARPELAAAAVEETLRFDPSVQAVPRTAAEDAELAGVRIPAGSRVHSMFSAIGRDPGWVDDPDSFRLDRSGPPRHFGFGFGIHFCLGAQLARLESRIALETLAATLPEMRLAPGFTPDHVRAGFVFRALTRLPAVWHPAAPTG